MALGVLTLTSNEIAKPSATLYVDEISFAGDSAYPTNGTAGFQALFQALVKCGRTVIAVIDITGAADYLVYDTANDKLKAFVRSTGLEVGNGVDTSGITFKVAVLSV